MNYFLSTDENGVDLVVKFSAKKPCKVIMDAFSLDTQSIYCQRHDIVEKNKVVILKLPCSPKNIVVSVDTDIPNNLQVEIIPNKVQKYDINLGKKQWEYIRFIEAFCKGISDGSIQPSEYKLKSPSGAFEIVYLPAILTYEGTHKGTPCQIGRNSGIIEVDASLFNQQTIAGQIALLCHEYAHFHENPRYGLMKEDENGADTYGLVLYLGAGYGETEYLNAFEKTFQRVDTNQNRNRIKNIENLALKINKGEIFGKPY
jgi:hypothetical protein